MKTHRMTYHTHTANWLYNNGNLWDLPTHYASQFNQSQQLIAPPKKMGGAAH